MVGAGGIIAGASKENAVSPQNVFGGIRVSSTILLRRGNADLQAVITSWTAQALHDRAPGASLDYWVTISQDTKGPVAQVCIGWPDPPSCFGTVKWSFADLVWPVRQEQVDAVVAGMLTGIGWPPPSGEESQEAGGQPGPA
jgi:hypothetical protein